MPDSPDAPDSPFTLSFPGATAAEANRYASELAAVIRDADRDVKVEQKRDRPDTQDLGILLQIILTSASTIAIARGISSWLARHSGAKIQIDKDGAVVASNLDSRDAARIAEAFNKRK
jgi:hypothetical protein